MFKIAKQMAKERQDMVRVNILKNESGKYSCETGDDKAEMGKYM